MVKVVAKLVSYQYRLCLIGPSSKQHTPSRETGKAACESAPVPPAVAGLDSRDLACYSSIRFFNLNSISCVQPRLFQFKRGGHLPSGLSMSAKAFYHKDTPPYTPEIPPELWGAIIQHATYAVGGYEPDLMALELGTRGGAIRKKLSEQWTKSLVSFRQCLSNGHC